MDKQTKKAEETISKLAKDILSTTPKEKGISEEQRKLESTITAQELYSSELSYED